MAASKTRTSTANKNGSRWLPAWRRLAIYLRDSFHCAYCGRDLHNAAAFEVTLDHLTCRCEGADHSNENLVTSCRSCNSSRGAKSWQSYATGGAVERIERLIATPVPAELAKSIIAGREVRPVAA
jgi:5-methylcytosine-specific restriction endonuclease McrA